MDPSRWKQIEDLYHAALERPPGERAAFLAQADPELRREVESLLAQESHGQPLNRPAWEDAASLLESTVAQITPGMQLGPYKIEGTLGTGGMGQVFRGLDTRLRRPVAIKVSHEKFTARFEREAQAISALNHPNICTLYDVGSSPAGVGYLVMEFVEGETLASRLKRGKLFFDDTLRYGQQIADALAAADAKGITHRDLKPANIMVTEAGIKVLDFGLAKSEQDANLTGSHMVLGTPAYMAPEQREGKDCDGRADIYAFGLVLYEMATGTRPEAVRRSAEMPPELERILYKCLEHDRELRYQHASEIRTDLQRLKRDTENSARAIAAQGTGIATPGTTTTSWKVVVPAVAAVVAIFAGGYFYFYGAPRLKGARLTDKDTIVLADFTNTTGDPVFDGTLRQGLAVQLEQSPFLSLVSDERIQKTFGLMGQKADARLTPQIAREICERTGGAAVLEGSIASLGTQYVVGLRAKNCRTGDVLDEEQVQAAKKEDVLNALSQIASKFRTRVGESLATVKRHNTPLEEATTPSLEALKAYSAAMTHLTSDHDLPAGVPFFQRAIEIDPKFAVAYASLGFTYGLLGEPALAAENNSKAYELRDHASDREKLWIAATYETQVTGNLEKALQTCELWVQAYPREKLPLGILGAFLYPTFGKYEKGVEVDKQLVELDPDFAVGYLQLAFNNQFAGRLGEAEKALQQASARKLEIPDIAVQRYDIAFLKRDRAGMDREATLAQSAADDLVYDREGFVLAYSGHLQEAKKMARRAVDLNQEADQRGKKALFEIGPALWEALFGNVPVATKSALTALDLSNDRDVEYGAAFALALSGESSRSRALAKDLETRFPEDTAVKGFYLPAIRALLELSGGEPSKAIDLLQVSRPYDRGVPPSIAPAFIGPFYTVYVRGLAYLAAHQGAEAAAEFQKILDGRNIVVSDPIGALAHLQLGRAFALSGDKTKAKAAYQDFLTLWKDADPGIPILQQAKTEYAKLQ
jgi:eukaryotic-like serine/threonine-protein kinase